MHVSLDGPAVLEKVGSSVTPVAVEVGNIQKQYGGLKALDGISLKIFEGEIFGVIGPNGAGKSTLFDVMCGYVKPTSGDVHILGTDIGKMAPQAIARLGVARSFQRTAVFAESTVLENLYLARHMHLNHSVVDRLLHRKKWRQDQVEFAKLAEETLVLTNLTDRKDRKAAELPYGVQRRLAVGIALMTEPRVFFLDEPAAGMNASEGEEFIELINAISPGRTVVIVEHDMAVIRALCHRCLVMVNGRPLTTGSPLEVLSKPEVVEAYLGVDDE